MPATHDKQDPQHPEGTDTDAIKAATEALQNKFYEVSQKVYQQNPQGAQGFDPNAQAGGTADNGGAYEGDYTVVDDDDKKE